MSSPRSATPLVVAIIILGALAAFGSWWLPDRSGLEGVPALAFAFGYALAFLGAQRAGFRLRWGEHSTRISMEEFTLVIGAILLPPTLLVGAIAASSITNQLLRRRPLVKAAFNVGQYTLAASAVAASYAGLMLLGASPLWASVPAAFVFSLVSQGATATLFARLEGTDPMRVFRERFLVWSIVTAFIGVSLGIAAYALWRVAPVAVLAIAPVFVLLARFGRLSEWSEEEVRLHQTLAQTTTRVAQTGDLNEGARTILEVAADVLAAGEVRMSIAFRRDAPSSWSWKHPAGGGAHGIRAPITLSEGEHGEIEAFPRRGRRAFGAREEQLLELIAASAASAARTHAAMLAITETNRRLTNANRELEEFTLWTTHDMREPLRSVGQLAQILHEDVARLSAAEIAELATRIRGGAEGLKERIKALHEFSRVVQQDVPYDSIDLGEVVESAIEGLSVRIAESRATIEAPATFPVARGQQARLIKVFANLLENALKYNTADEPHVWISYVERPDEIEFSVRDNGPGIDPSMRERVFQLFQRGKVGRESGSGAGLAIVKRIVEQHGGRVWIEGAPGEGADFRFTLPIERAATPVLALGVPDPQSRATPPSPTS